MIKPLIQLMRYINRTHSKGAQDRERQRTDPGNPAGKKEYLNTIAEKYYDDIYRFCCYQTGSRQMPGI